MKSYLQWLRSFFIKNENVENQFTQMVRYYDMKILFISLLNILLLSFVQGQEWEVYKNSEYKFSVAVPGKFLINQRDVLTDAGEIKVTSHAFKTNDGASNLLYQVLHYPIQSMPEGADSEDYYQEVFASIVEGAVENAQAELFYENYELTLVDPFVIWKMKTKNDIFIKSKAVLHNQRVYILQVMTRKNKSLNDDITTFIESLRFFESK